MKIRHTLYTAFAVTLICAAGQGCINDLPRVEIVEQEGGFLFRECDRDIMFYQREPKSIAGEYTRCNYIHPLYGLDGEVLTEDFPADHLHHRGIFWAWHQLYRDDRRLGDGWSIDRIAWRVQEVRIFQTRDRSATLSANVTWHSPVQAPPVVLERTLITVHPSTARSQAIDFQIHLLALEENVRLGGSDDEKGYGGFSLRIRLPEDTRFIGPDGEVVPQNTPVSACPWLDVMATFSPGADRSGVAVLIHPQTPGYPQPWILRRKGSMQNPVFPGRQPVLLSREQPLVLRYRILLHRGGGDAETMQRAWRCYADCRAVDML